MLHLPLPSGSVEKVIPALSILALFFSCGLRVKTTSNFLFVERAFQYLPEDLSFCEKMTLTTCGFELKSSEMIGKRQRCR